MHTVLLIEDQIEIANMLRTVISRNGHRAMVAFNLAEAEGVWAAYKAEIDVLVTDNALPDGSGIAFAERITREKPGLKVIVTSGMVDGIIPDNFHRLDKPFDIASFLKTLETI